MRRATYNSGMIILRAPSGASEQLSHAIELVNRDLDGSLDHLDTEQQNEFWTNLHQFALGETRGDGRNARLIAAERVNTAVREALEMTDEKIALHLANVGTDDRDGQPDEQEPRSLRRRDHQWDGQPARADTGAEVPDAPRDARREGEQDAAQSLTGLVAATASS